MMANNKIIYDYIKSKSVLYPIFASDVWQDYHISNLLGVDNNIFILDNTAARQNYFPLQYKEPYEEFLHENPALEVITKESINIKINYVLLVGTESIDQQRDQIIYELAKQNGSIAFQNELVELWKIDISN